MDEWRETYFVLGFHRGPESWSGKKMESGDRQKR